MSKWFFQKKPCPSCPDLHLLYFLGFWIFPRGCRASEAWGLGYRRRGKLLSRQSSFSCRLSWEKVRAWGCLTLRRVPPSSSTKWEFSFSPFHPVIGFLILETGESSHGGVEPLELIDGELRPSRHQVGILQNHFEFPQFTARPTTATSSSPTWAASERTSLWIAASGFPNF